MSSYSLHFVSAFGGREEGENWTLSRPLIHVEPDRANSHRSDTAAPRTAAQSDSIGNLPWFHKNGAGNEAIRQASYRGWDRVRST